jgi:hypothetical protein
MCAGSVPAEGAHNLVAKSRQLIMRLLFGLLALAAIAGVALFVMRDTRDPRVRAVDDAFDAISNRDAKALFELISDEEKKGAKLTEEVFGRFLNEYVLKDIDGLKRVGEPSTSDQLDSSDFYQATQDFTGGLRVSLTGRLHGGEAKVDSVVFMLFMARMNYEAGNVPLPPTGARLQALIDRLRSETPELNEIGIDGFYFSGAENERYEAIEDFAAEREAVLRRREGD